MSDGIAVQSVAEAAATNPAPPSSGVSVQIEAAIRSPSPAASGLQSRGEAIALNPLVRGAVGQSFIELIARVPPPAPPAPLTTPALVFVLA